MIHSRAGNPSAGSRFTQGIEASTWFPISVLFFKPQVVSQPLKSGSTTTLVSRPKRKGKHHADKSITDIESNVKTDEAKHTQKCLVNSRKAAITSKRKEHMLPAFH